MRWHDGLRYSMDCVFLCCLLIVCLKGSGKSHYIRSELKNRSYLTITVNESFTVASAIEKLKNEELLLGSCIYVNVTVVAQVRYLFILYRKVILQLTDAPLFLLPAPSLSFC